jgi:hypothetical protein
MSATVDTEKTKPELEKEDDRDGDDFPSMFKNLLYNVNWKLGIVMLILGFFIFSNLFVDNVISKLSDTTELGMVNTKGSVLQLLAYTLILLSVDLMIKGNLL